MQVQSATRAGIVVLFGLPLLAQSIPPAEAALLADARASAMRYADWLPNLLCVEHIDRAADWNNAGTWTQVDTLAVQVGYIHGKELYKTLAHGQHASTQSMETISGAISEGEFGSTLRWIFDPAANATFRWIDREKTNRFQTSVFEYSVGAARSRLTLRAYSRSVTAGFHGQVFIDEASHSVVRVVMEADPPPDFPIKNSYVRIDYDWVRLGDHRYLVPVKGEIRMTEPPPHRRTALTSPSDQIVPPTSYSAKRVPVPETVFTPANYRNRIQFRDYRQFTADSKISFSDPMPELGKTP